MYDKISRIDRGELESKFRGSHPNQADFIHRVVNDYAASIEQRSARKETPQVNPKTANKRAPVLLKAAGPGTTTQLSNTDHEQADNVVPIEKRNTRKETPQVNPKTVNKRAAVIQKAAGPATTSPWQPSQSDTDHEQADNVILHEFKEYLADNSSNRPIVPSYESSRIPALEQQREFLSMSDQGNQVANGHFSNSLEEAVLLSPVVEGFGLGHSMPSQFALLGHLSWKQSVLDPRVMLNTNVPFSAFICGLQGSGKSHTTSCIIENCSLSFSALGTLRKPLSTLVLHFNEYSSNVSSQPSEAAFLASLMPEYNSHQLSIPVSVLATPSNFHNLEKMYSQIPNVQIRPLRLQPRHLNISAMLSLMSMGKNDSVPLYMAQVTKVLREMAINSGGSFDYFGFRARLNALPLDRSQTIFLDQRLDLLDSFLDLKGESSGSYFLDGGVTILDLSCPFMDQSTACILFRIAIDLFLHAYPSRGKMIVADEAHKYMTDTPAAKALTETFLNIIRQQRHLGVRLIISTQEPTISPRLIDLCSITLIHRFTSPDWYSTIQKHVTIGDERDSSTSADSEDSLYRISSLRTGEALVFAPSAYLLDDSQSVIDVKQRAFKMVVRKRITWDGGKTVVCVR